MYSNKFVMCVMVNGKPAKEFGNGSVQLPFGTEYKLLFHNKHPRRAVVKFFIDGENVSGNGYIIPAYGKIEIERHAEVARKFLFVPKDSDEAIISGKNGPDPERNHGVIEARFYLEKYSPQPQVVHVPLPYPVPTPYIPPYRPRGPYWDNVRYGSGTVKSATPDGISYSFRGETTARSLCQSDLLTAGANLMAESASVPQTGVTVEGGYSTQQFTTTYVDTETDATVLKITLMGGVGTPQRVVVAAPAPVTEPSHPDPYVDEIERLKAENAKLQEQIALRKIEAERQKELEALRQQNEALKQQLGTSGA